jgi:serpin B
MNQGGAGADAPARADDAFGADLYRVLGGAGAGNLVFSPASIAAALQMALLGARGETAAELARALHLGGPEAAVSARASLRLLGGMLGESLDQAAAAGREDFTFRMPNTMWVQSGLPLQPEFLSGIADAAAAAVRDADFIHEHDKARTEINRVIAEQTAGTIRDLIPPGVFDHLTRLVLASAIYLKAAWANKFPAGATDEMPFHLTPGSGGDETVPVPMMHLTSNLGYRRADGYQVVLLPYAAVPLTMAIVLPDGPLDPLSERLTGGGVRGLLGGVQPTRVRLSMPRFRITAQFGLKPALERLGVVRAFGPGDADFTGITTAEKLYISHVLHKAYIDVDENGTEAAAATAVVARAVAHRIEPTPVAVTVDRPFLFAITDTATGVPLFLGHVTNPAATPGG